MKRFRKTVRRISAYGFLLLLFMAVAVSAAAQVRVGVEAGDRIKYAYEISNAPPGTPLPTSLELEFLSVQGTNATLRMTVHLANGTADTDTVTVNIVTGEETAPGALSGIVIPANLTTGDSVFVTGLGSAAIGGETSRTYAGASRTVVHTSFSQFGSELTYYWDKQTGVAVEVSVTGPLALTVKAVETNMWGAAPFFVQWWFLASVAGVVIAVVGVVYFWRRRRPHP